VNTAINCFKEPIIVGHDSIEASLPRIKQYVAVFPLDCYSYWVSTRDRLDIWRSLFHLEKGMDADGQERCNRCLTLFIRACSSTWSGKARMRKRHISAALQIFWPATLWSRGQSLILRRHASSESGHLSRRRFNTAKATLSSTPGEIRTWSSTGTTFTSWWVESGYASMSKQQNLGEHVCHEKWIGWNPCVQYFAVSGPVQETTQNRWRWVRTMYDTAGMHGYGYGTILRPENENNKLRNVLMPTTLSSHTRLLSELELSTRHLYLRM